MTSGWGWLAMGAVVALVGGCGESGPECWLGGDGCPAGQSCAIVRDTPTGDSHLGCLPDDGNANQRGEPCTRQPTTSEGGDGSDDCGPDYCSDEGICEYACGGPGPSPCPVGAVCELFDSQDYGLCRTTTFIDLIATVHASYVDGVGDCGAPETFDEELLIETMAGAISITPTPSGGVSEGTIDPYGAFAATSADGARTYEGTLDNALGGMAIHRRTDDAACTTTWSTLLIPI